MDRPVHPINKEELKAYLAGALAVERAAAVVAHLEHCQECRTLAAQLRSVSQEMVAAWRAHPSPPGLTGRSFDARESAHLPADDRETTLRSFPWPPKLVARWVWVAAAGLGFILALAALSISQLFGPLGSGDRASRTNRIKHNLFGPQPRSNEPSATSLPQLPFAPMILRTASLTLITKDFNQTRVVAEGIVRRYQGYGTNLTVNAPAETLPVVRATFRVPAEHLDAVVKEIRTLGQVEQESRHEADVTERYRELAGRLSDARSAEQRLMDALNRGDVKPAGLLGAERDLARLRSEIERLAADTKDMEQQVRLPTLQLQLREGERQPGGITISVSRVPAPTSGQHVL